MRGLVAVVVVTALAGHAIAQPSQATIVAADAFEKGRKLAADGKWEEACAAFEQSLRAEAAFGTQYNLAGCYVQIRKLASARVLYVDLADRDTNAARKQDSSVKAKALESRIPKLLITAPNAPEGLTITVDGAPAIVGEPVRVDLGAHAVIAKAPKHADKTLTPSVTKEGETVSVEVKLLAVATAAPTRETVPDTTTPTPTGEPGEKKIPWTGTIDDTPPAKGHKPTWTKMIIGGGAVLTGVGIGFGVSAWVSKKDAHDSCEDGACGAGSQQLQDANATLKTARSRALYSTIFTVSGVAVIGLGVVLAFTADDEYEDPPPVALGVGDSPLGLTFGGAF